jgi:hypothetical protein
MGRLSRRRVCPIPTDEIEPVLGGGLGAAGPE